ncbi:MAG: hypothetical protein D6698_14690 [Gammaproteobacteria bacterium]|nr:MAG: hypothetical protein D6698_14690 [Gammaproteobacteria bacterium]
MSAMSKKEIQRELRAIEAGEARSWPQISALLNSVQTTKYWQGESESFSKWIEDFGKKIGLGRATLWRYLSAGRKYKNLKAAAEKMEPSLHYPQLQELQDYVSPENLELLEKLNRVMEPDDAYVLMDKVIRGEVRRQALREKWQAFRPALAGQTARGKHYSSVKVDRSNEFQAAKVREGEIYTAIKESAPMWLDCMQPYFIKVLSNVRPDVVDDACIGYKSETLARPIFDAVVAIKRSVRDPLCLHGIEIIGRFHGKALSKLVKMAPYCDFFWIATHHAVPNFSPDKIPEWAGVLVLTETEEIRVLREPEHTGSKQAVNQMLRGIILKAYGL